MTVKALTVNQQGKYEYVLVFKALDISVNERPFAYRGCVDSKIAPWNRPSILASHVNS